MKRLLAFLPLGIFLLVLSGFAVAGIMRDNTTNTIAASSGALKVEGAGGGSAGGFAAGLLHVKSTATAEFSNSVITGHSAFSTNTQLWYLGSTSSSNNDIALINRQIGDVFISTNNVERMRVTDGGVSIGTSGLAASAMLELSSTTKALLLSRMTTTQRDALTGVNGMIIYNTTTTTMQGYTNGTWSDL